MTEPRPNVNSLHNPKKREPQPPAHKGSVQSALDAMGIDKVCELIMSGQPYSAIADLAGGSKAAFINWLTADPNRSVRVREARMVAAGTFDELAESGIKNAADPFELAKAKELAYHYRWRSAKFNPEYSEKVRQEMTGKDGAPIEHALILRDLPEDELTARIEAALKAAGNG